MPVPWTDKTKRVPGESIWCSSGLGSRTDRTSNRRLDLMTFQHWLKKSTKPIPRGPIWWLSGHGSRSRQNQFQEARFDDFPAMAPEVDKTSPRKLDLMAFRPWLQKSTKPVPGNSIWWFSGHGSRSRQNQSQDAWFDDFRELDPGINKTMAFMNFQWSRI